MFSTMLWYLEPESNGEETLFGKTVDGISVEYVRRDGKLFASRLISSNPRNYLDSRFIPNSNIEIINE